MSQMLAGSCGFLIGQELELFANYQPGEEVWIVAIGRSIGLMQRE